MCTAITFEKKDFYFGRSLDLEYSYHETVTIVPRAYPLHFRKVPSLSRHHAVIGMAFVQDNYPLFYEAVNEKGLGMAGLNFPDNARYFAEEKGKDNLAPFEFIPYILASCSTLDEARDKLKNVHLVDIPFSRELPNTSLHWIIADRSGAVVVETTEEGMRVYDNPVGVLTNNPPFPMQMNRLSDYMALSILPPENNFSAALPLRAYSRGMGAMGLPGDLSSASRFVRAAFIKHNSLCGEREEDCVGQFFHILGGVEQQRGCVKLGEKFEITIYTSCCNATRGIYYYTTYGNRRIRAVDMHRENLESDKLVSYPVTDQEDIDYLN